MSTREIIAGLSDGVGQLTIGEHKMTDAVLWHRIQFTVTITYHYLFPQLTMGLGLVIVALRCEPARGPLPLVAGESARHC